jgi:pyruvate dehydrogenase E2 component (dihydrolipoamide acetyltransferase)
VEVFTDGVIEQLLIQPGTRVPVGTVLAMIGPTGAPTAPMGDVGKAPAEVRAPAEAEPHVPRRDSTVRPAEQPAVTQPSVSAPAPRVRASPLARKLAAELGIDLHTVQGTGPHGAIERADVERMVT